MKNEIVDGSKTNAVCAAIAAVCLLAACRPSVPDRQQGYIEGEFVYVAAPYSGALEKLDVQRGAQVKSGDPLFALEKMPEKATRDEAEQRVNQARATLEDAKLGKRPPEVAAIEAVAKQARASLSLAEKEVARQEKLAGTAGATTEHDIDRARTTQDEDRARVAEIDAELETARMGERPDLVKAAEANLQIQQANLVRMEWELAQKQQSAPQSGIVFDTLYREGDWVAAGMPVIVLLPPRNVKLRIFVGEPRLGSLQLGEPLQVFVDGVSGSVTGKVSFISPRAEYSPPMVYSRENRKKFVFLVEASFAPDVALNLHPGQPVEVEFGAHQP